MVQTGISKANRVKNDKNRDRDKTFFSTASWYGLCLLSGAEEIPTEKKQVAMFAGTSQEKK